MYQKNHLLIPVSYFYESVKLFMQDIAGHCNPRDLASLTRLLFDLAIAHLFDLSRLVYV